MGSSSDMIRCSLDGTCFPLSKLQLKAALSNLEKKSFPAMPSSLPRCEIVSYTSSLPGSYLYRKLIEEDNPGGQLIDKKGCRKQHFVVQECFRQEGNWERCAAALQEFQTCLNTKYF